MTEGLLTSQAMALNSAGQWAALWLNQFVGNRQGG